MATHSLATQLTSNPTQQQPNSAAIKQPKLLWHQHNANLIKSKHTGLHCLPSQEWAITSDSHLIANGDYPIKNSKHTHTHTPFT